MGYLFPVNPVSRARSEAEEVAIIERIGEHEKNSKQQDEQKQHDDSDELKKKVSKLISHTKLLEAIDLSDLDSKAKLKLLEIVRATAASFLKRELLSVAKSILTISAEENDDDEIDDEDLSFSDHLAKVVMKLAAVKRTASQGNVVQKLGKTNPLEDKNAGFLVHYCKNILDQKINHHKEPNDFKSEKLSKHDLDKYLKSNS